MMTTGDDNPGESSAKAVLDVFATIRGRTKEIYWIFKTSPAVATVVDECDIGHSNDFMTGHPEHVFDVYVEATTHTDEPFCWTVSVWLTSKGWELDRVISSADADVRKFAGARFETFDALAGSYSALLDEFVESAKAFDFGNPHQRASDRV
jgi:hypothetical protein